MQNLTECARRHYIISKKLLSPAFKCSSGKYNGINMKFTCFGGKYQMRLQAPASLCAYKEIRRDLINANSLPSMHTLVKVYSMQSLPELRNVRFFSTTRALAQEKQKKEDDTGKSEGKSNKQKSDENKKKSGDGKDPDKEHLPNEEWWPFIIHISILSTIVGVIVVLAMPQDKLATKEMTYTSWNKFVHQILAKGEVEAIHVIPNQNMVRIVLQPDAVIENKRFPTRSLYMMLPDINTIEEKIRQAEDKLGIPYSDRVPIIYLRPDMYSRLITYVIFFVSVLVAGSLYMSKLRNYAQSVTKNLFSPKITFVEPNKGKGVSFSDVAGLQEAKVEVMEFVDYLKHPDRYKVLGAKVPKGALLLGPPGCGKTLLAKAVATESNVPFLSVNGPEFVEMLGGLGASRVRHLFVEAKKRAPCIIYIDEIDAFGQTRSNLASQFSNSESERTLVQLLVEMDGMTTRDDIIILASTNRAEVLDKALLRPGRFDRHILIDLPTQIERKQIFEKHLTSLSLEQPAASYAEYLSNLTPGFTGADIANVCNEAALRAARVSKKKINGSDLMYAIERARSGPLKTTNAVSASEAKIIAYREAGYALMAWLLEHTDPVAKVSIVPSTTGSLGRTRTVESLLKLIHIHRLQDIICMNLGGRMAEQMVFGCVTSATMEHLKIVTEMVYKQVREYGMSPVVGPLSFDPDTQHTRLGRPYSKKFAHLIDIEVRRIIFEASSRAEKLLRDNRNLLNTLADQLLKKETLYYEDIERLIGPPPFSKKRPEIPTLFLEHEDKTKNPTPKAESFL